MNYKKYINSKYDYKNLNIQYGGDHKILKSYIMTFENLTFTDKEFELLKEIPVNTLLIDDVSKYTEEHHQIIKKVLIYVFGMSRLDGVDHSKIIFNEVFNVDNKSSYIYKLLNIKKNCEQKIVIIAPGDSPSKIVILLNLLYRELLIKSNIHILYIKLSGGTLSDNDKFSSYINKILDQNNIKKSEINPPIFSFVDAICSGNTLTTFNTLLSKQFSPYPYNKEYDIDSSMFCEDLILNVINYGSIFDYAEYYKIKGHESINGRCICKYNEIIEDDDIKNIANNNVLICNMVLIHYYFEILKLIKSAYIKC